MKKIIILALLSVLTIQMSAVELDSNGRDTAYVSTILKRSQKIVDQLGLKDKFAARQVLNIIANRYFKLNDIHESCAGKIKSAKDSLSGKAKQYAVEYAQNECDAQLYKHHFEFAADLSLYLNEKQIEAVKDGLTYGVVKVTYDATLDMIPTLKPEEKTQILAWLKEAREFSMDAENSNKKHEWFGKYKGRINNYLAKRGYDLVKEREGWYKRIDSKKNKK